MDSSIPGVEPTRRSRVWGRVFAGVYEPSLWAGERAGLRTQRKKLLATARGRTVEIGSGTGLNLAHYPGDLGELILTEPDSAMRSRLDKRLSGVARPVDADAEHLPFADGSVDTVVSTLVLCTIDDPEQALREVARVLAPDGQFLFIEHVRSDSATLARWQDRLATPWCRFAHGCRCNRAIAELMVSCGFQLDALAEARWRAMPPIVRPLIIGRARPGGSDD